MADSGTFEAGFAELLNLHERGYTVGLGDPRLGGPHPRDDIDELAHDKPDLFNLFVLAFAEIRNRKPEDPHSFYQISGIHGLPAGPWNGIAPPHKEEGFVIGFCTHSDDLFPIWHRPYVALLEQTLFIEVNLIAKKFPEKVRQKYVDAAKQFRLPYWDYFRPRGKNSKFPTIRDLYPSPEKPNFDYDFSAPSVLTIPTLMIRQSKNDHLVPMDNPLTFAKLPTEGPAAIQDVNWKAALDIEGDHYSKSRTHRHPTKDSPDGDVERMNKAVNMRREDNLRYVINLMTSYLYQNFRNFATDAQGPGGDYDHISSGSIEAYHNDYHVILGGLGGHMSSVPIAAHDPIFWMHHGMVERVFSIWQIINPDIWLAESTIPGKPSKGTSPLIPFKKPTGGTPDGFWSADDARNTLDFGYYYSKFEDRSDPLKTRHEVERLYEWGRRLYNVPFQENPWPIYDMKKDTSLFNFPEEYPDADEMIAQLPNMEGLDPTYPPTQEGGAFSREWYIDNKVGRLALNGAFTIFWFIDPEPDRITATDPVDYMTLPTLAGLSHVFAAAPAVCDNCADQKSQALVVRNTAPITASLLDWVEVGKLGSLDPEHVIPFLVKNLTWRIIGADYQVADPKKVENFAVNVTVKATPLPRDGKTAPHYLPYPQVARGIASRERIESFKREQVEKLAALQQELDETVNWSLVGIEKPVDDHDAEFAVREENHRVSETCCKKKE